MDSFRDHFLAKSEWVCLVVMIWFNFYNFFYRAIQVIRDFVRTFTKIQNFKIISEFQN